MRHKLIIENTEITVSGEKEVGYTIKAPSLSINHQTGTLASVKSYLDSIREALTVHFGTQSYSLRVGKEKVEIGAIKVVDCTIRHNREREVSEIKFVSPRKYFVKIPSYELEYVSNTLAQFIEDYTIVKDAFLEEVKFKHQPLMFVAEEIKSSIKQKVSSVPKERKERAPKTQDESLSLLSFL